MFVRMFVRILLTNTEKKIKCELEHEAILQIACIDSAVKYSFVIIVPIDHHRVCVCVCVFSDLGWRRVHQRHS